MKTKRQDIGISTRFLNTKDNASGSNILVISNVNLSISHTFHSLNLIEHGQNSVFSYWVQRKFGKSDDEVDL